MESAARPDGTRAGPPAFFDWMNGGKLSYVVDFTHPDGLRRLLRAADVVIESSRPAALDRRGLGPADIPAPDGRVWLRITGHGTGGDRADWVAFGDDAAVSGGLVGGTDDAPPFCGDAIADPLTGLEAALAVVESRAAAAASWSRCRWRRSPPRYASSRRLTKIAVRQSPPVERRPRGLGADNAVVDHLVAERLATSC